MQLVPYGYTIVHKGALSGTWRSGMGPNGLHSRNEMVEFANALQELRQFLRQGV